MLKLVCKVTIGKLIFDFVNSVEINSSWKDLTSTAVIKLPRKVYTIKNDRLDSLIKRGDKVKIELGYDDILIDEFAGYVTSVKPTYPIEITCDDEMFLYKKQGVNPKNFPSNSTIKDVFDYLGIPESKYETVGDSASNISLGGSFAITNDEGTAAKVFEKLEKASAILNIYIRNGKLMVGKQYDPKKRGVDHFFVIGKNIVTTNLSFRKKEEILLDVTAISKNANSKQITVHAGDHEGDKRTLTYNDLTQAELQKQADADVDKLKYTGYTGDFTAFGIPSVQHGDIVKLIDLENKEREGTLYIDVVQKTFGTGGYRQKITLGKVADIK
jgi:hypothetical protein